MSHESFAPATKFGKNLASPEVLEPQKIEVTDVLEMQRTILQTEASLGLRFGVDLEHNGYPRMGFTNETWNYLRRAYEQKCRTQMDRMIAEIEPADEHAVAIYTLPLAGFGLSTKAVEGRFSYQPTPVKRGNQTFTMLGRRVLGSQVRMVNNRFHKPHTPGNGSTSRISSGSVQNNAMRAGRLGSNKY